MDIKMGLLRCKICNSYPIVYREIEPSTDNYSMGCNTHNTQLGEKNWVVRGRLHTLVDKWNKLNTNLLKEINKIELNIIIKNIYTEKSDYVIQYNVVEETSNLILAGFINYPDAINFKEGVIRGLSLKRLIKYLYEI